ncbi:hypothetical protein N7513_001997 [Penicillium frequentans]|uniref:Uncharacterized protein n=1 Tax=Penicillium frequentans TaxID=3151616 RepID=A0AAD6GCW1_9EURO|nr:hypothetical protein N7494_008936 [Penicillium glabrum]KAJ5559598.1 hypothetical protein N7513_001997 [Penicillium glabrum]
MTVSRIHQSRRQEHQYRRQEHQYRLQEHQNRLQDPSSPSPGSTKIVARNYSSCLQYHHPGPRTTKTVARIHQNWRWETPILAPGPLKPSPGTTKGNDPYFSTLLGVQIATPVLVRYGAKSGRTGVWRP